MFKSYILVHSGFYKIWNSFPKGNNYQTSKVPFNFVDSNTWKDVVSNSTLVESSDSKKQREAKKIECEEVST